MNYRIVLFIIISSFQIFSIEVKGQSKLEKDIVGLWKASKIYNVGAVIPETSKKQIEIIQKQLIGSKFLFKSDRNFSFESPINEMSIKKGNWKIMPDNGEIIIKDWKDKDKQKPILMKIKVLQKGDKTVFILEETFFAFEMIRIS